MDLFATVFGVILAYLQEETDTFGRPSILQNSATLRSMATAAKGAVSTVWGMVPKAKEVGSALGGTRAFVSHGKNYPEWRNGFGWVLPCSQPGGLLQVVHH